MKKPFLFIIVSACSLFPQTYYLNIWSKGTVTSIPIGNIQKITFAGVSDTFSGDSGINIVQAFKLGQNFPNPFNPNTTFIYQIPASGEVTIRIFNLRGELVKTMIKTHPSAGDYLCSWNGTDEQGQVVPSGLYFYQVTYANNVQTRKMIFVK